MPAGSPTTIDRMGVPTPGRQMSLVCDFPETTAAEPAFAAGRSRWEIKAQPGSQNVQQLASGGWTLQSLQETVSNVQEVTDPTGSVIRASAFNLATGVEEVPTQRPPTDLPGATTGGAFGLAVGGYHLEKQVGSGAWNSALTTDQTAFPGPLSGTNLVQDRLGLSNTAYPDNAQFGARFQDFAAAAHSSDYIGTFYWGGPLFSSDAGGGGNWALSFTGDGRGILFCRVPTNAGLQWYALREFRFADPAQAQGHPHDIHVIPYMGPDGPMIEIHAGLSDSAPPASLSRSGFVSAPTYPRFHVVPIASMGSIAGLATLDGIVLTDAALIELARLKKASGTGPVRYDLNRASRARVQLFQRTFPSTGTLLDAVFPVPLYATTRTNLKVRWVATMPAGTTLACAAYDATTGNALALVTSGAGYAEFQSAYGSAGYFLKFTFNADSTSRFAPILWSWQATKDGWFGSTRAPQWEVPVTGWHVIGAGKDPEDESAHCTIEDAQHQYPKLYDRADIPSKLVTTAPDQYNGSTTNTVELFRGPLADPESEVWGTTGRTNSHPDARYTEARFEPDYKNLRLTLAPMRVNLLNDPNAPPSDDGSFTPHKVTNIIRAALAWCGNQSWEIDVPDSSIRFWPSPGDSEDSHWIEPRAELGALIVGWLRDFLGWRLIMDGNAGVRGMWRAIKPSVPDADGAYTSVWNFTEYTPSGRFHLDRRSYPPNTSPILKPLRIRQVAPEANLIEVVGIATGIGGPQQMVQYIRNKASADFYATSGGADLLTADPNDPDYLGHTRMVSLVDPGLNSVDAINFMIRRLYDRIAHRLKFYTFEAPLWFLDDPDDVITVENTASDGSLFYTTQPAYLTLPDGQRQLRPLRFGDPVVLTRIDQAPIQGLVYSVHPGADKDHWQSQILEVVEAVPLVEGIAL